MLPVLFTVPGLDWEIQAYGLMLALALLLGWVVMLRLGERDRLPPTTLGTAYVLGMVVGLAAARIGWLLQRAGDQARISDLVTLSGDELAPFAGLTAAGVVAGLHLMRRRIPVVAGYDVAAPALAAAAMVERLGALLAGHGYGQVAPSLPWAIRFPAGSPAFAEHEQRLTALLGPGATQSLPVHPTQIYALLLAGATLAVALWLRRRRTFSGQVFLGTGIAYLLGRALIEEWFRADASPAMMGPLNAGQVGSLVLVISLGVVMGSRARLARVRPEAFRPWDGGRWSPASSRPEPPRGPGAAGGSSPKGAAAETGKGRAANTPRGTGASKGKGGRKGRKRRRKKR